MHSCVAPSACPQRQEWACGTTKCDACCGPSVIILATTLNPKPIGVPLFTLCCGTSTSSHLITHRGHPQCSSSFWFLLSFSRFQRWGGSRTHGCCKRSDHEPCRGQHGACRVGWRCGHAAHVPPGPSIGEPHRPQALVHDAGVQWYDRWHGVHLRRGEHGVSVGCFFIDFVGGLVYKVCSFAVLKAGVDDPLDAGAVHLGAGA